jgi:hypothetical protein
MTRKSKGGAVPYWLHLVPIETKEVLLLGAPVSGPGGILPSAKYPSFDRIRLTLLSIVSVPPNHLEEAAKTLAAQLTAAPVGADPQTPGPTRAPQPITALSTTILETPPYSTSRVKQRT